MRRLFVALTAILLACAPARADVVNPLAVGVVHEDVAAELDEANAAFSAAWVAGEIEALSASYTPDAIVHPPAGGVLTTPEQIRALWAPIVNQQRVGHRLEPTLRQRLASEDEVLEMGRWHTARRNDAGEAPWVSGCYTVIWRRDGTAGWRMLYDSWTAPNANDWACRPR